MFASRSRKRPQTAMANTARRPGFERLESLALLEVTINTFDTMTFGTMQIEKLTSQADADVPTGPIVPVGPMPVYPHQINSTGSVALENVVVTNYDGTPGIPGDDFPSMPTLNGGFNVGHTNMDDTLDLNETWLFFASRVITTGT